MGSRPSQFKRGGGFLNGVDGVITGYRFTDEFNGVAFVPGKKAGSKDEKFHTLFCEVSVRVDGATEDVNQHLFVGGYDDYEISEDGLTLTDPSGGECNIGEKTGAAIFFKSVVDGGFPEDRLSDDPNTVNFEPIIGSRVKFVQRKDEESTRKLGKRLDKKTGKSYDRTNLVVDTVYETPDAAPKAAAKAAPAKGKAAAPAVIDIDSIAGQAVVEIVTRLGKPTEIKAFTMESLKSSVLKTAEAKPHVTAIRKRIMEAEFLTSLAEAEGVEYEGVAYLVGFNPAKKLVTVTEA
jgi:hypothetical protein